MFINNREIPWYVYCLCMLLAAAVGAVVGSLPVAVLSYFDQKREMAPYQLPSNYINSDGPNYHLPKGVEAPARMPEDAPYDDPHPLQCSRVTYAGPNINSTVTYTVPEGWSMWGCLKERFPEWSDRGVMESITLFRFYAEREPSLKYCDPDHIPAGYVFIGGGDGAGPNPIE